MTRTTVVVTGASGFIGARLTARLRQDPELQVLTLGRSPERDDLVCALEAASPSLWRERGAIDAIVHLGSYTPKNRAGADDAAPIVSSIVDGTQALLHSLAQPPRRFVYASTLDVYRPQPQRCIDESSPTGPTALYGAAKLFAEELVRAYARRTGASYAILRIGHVYGPGEERYEKVIPNLIRAMLAGRQPELSGDGSTLRDFLYVDDAVAAVVAAAGGNESLDPLNVVRGESVAILEVAEQIAAIAGYRGGFRFAGENGSSLRFDNAALRRHLGIDRFLPLREGLSREVAAFRERIGAAVSGE